MSKCPVTVHLTLYGNVTATHVFSLQFWHIYCWPKTVGWWLTLVRHFTLTLELFWPLEANDMIVIDTCNSSTSCVLKFRWRNEATCLLSYCHVISSLPEWLPRATFGVEVVHSLSSLRYNLRKLCTCNLWCLPALSHYYFLMWVTQFWPYDNYFFFSRIIPFVVQFWVFILPNLGRTQDAIDSIWVFSHLIMNRLILAVWTLCKSNRSYCTIICSFGACLLAVT